MTLPPIAGVARPTVKRTVALVPLSPRLGTCYSECSRLARSLAHAGVIPAYVPTHELPMAPAGMEKVPGFAYPRGIIHLVDTVASADAVILAAPVQKNVVSGWARNLVEIIRGGLAGKPVLPVVAAGSVRAHLAGNDFRADLHGNFDAFALPAVIVSPDVPAAVIRTRIDASVADLLACIGVESDRAERVS